MFGCCQYSQRKYIDKEGNIDTARYEDVTGDKLKKVKDGQPNQPKNVCMCACHRDGITMMC